MRLSLAILAAASLAAAPGPKNALANFAAAAQTGMTAYKAQNFKAAEAAFDTALANAPQRAAALYYLSASAARNGESEKALALLRRYAEMGGTKPLSPDDFAGVSGLPGFRFALTRIEDNRRARCPCRTIFQGTADPFIAEGIALDSGRLFVGGVAARRIVTIADGRAMDFVARLPENYSPFGMAADRKRRTLWVSAATVPQSGGGRPDTSALIAFDLDTGALRKLYPATGKLDFGDIALAPDGTVYISDSLEGSLFRLRPGAEALERVGPAGLFSSAQGMVVSADGMQLLVADYEMGLFRVDLRAQTLQTIRIPGAVTTLGMDGIARLADGSFLATQNGLATPRIVRFTLSEDWSSLTSLGTVAANAPQIADMALIAPDGNNAVAVGVAQWSAYDSGKRSPARPVPAWSIVRLDQSKRS